MAAFKQLNAQDVIISPFEVNKAFTFKKAAYHNDFEYIEDSQTYIPDSLVPSDVGIRRLYGLNINTVHDSSSQDFDDIPFSSTYHAIKHLYYGNFISGGANFEPATASLITRNSDGTVTGSAYVPNYFSYAQTTLDEKKYIDSFVGGQVGVISIPTRLYGDYIQPNSFSYSVPPSGNFITTTLIDDGEGRVTHEGRVVGNINYSHGIVAITRTSSLAIDQALFPNYDTTAEFFSSSYDVANIIIGDEEDWIRYVVTSSEVTCSFSSSYSVYETQYKVTSAESDFNYSLNPSTHDSSSGDILNTLTGSEFSPYITTVGLYSDDHELLAVGKLAQPLPTSKTTDTTILINFDKV